MYLRSSSRRAKVGILEPEIQCDAWHGFGFVQVGRAPQSPREYIPILIITIDSLSPLPPEAFSPKLLGSGPEVDVEVELVPVS